MVFLGTLFFLIAAVYSVAGLAGGSAYLAVLAWAGLPRETLVTLALLCNLVVSLEGGFSFARAGHFRPALFWPLAAGSVPFAFLGGRMPIGDGFFNLLLGLSLLTAALRMFFPVAGACVAPSNSRAVGASPSRSRCSLIGAGKAPSGRFTFLFVGPLLGGALGFLAGLIGLGGGIFLAPILILSGAASPKETAAVTAPFIFVNSLAGLLAHHPTLTPPFFREYAPLLLAVGCGGWLGSQMGARSLSPVWVQRTGAVLLGTVGLKLLRGF